MTAVIVGGFMLGGRVRADDTSGAYVGGNFGRAKNGYQTNFIDEQIESEATSLGETAAFPDRSIRRMSDVWWADAGYFFTPYFGVDAAFLHAGELKYYGVGSLSTSGSQLFVSSQAEITSHGPALSLLWRLPLAYGLEAELRVGDYYGKSTLDDYVTAGSNKDLVRQSQSGSSLLVGAGAAYSVGGGWLIRLDYLRLNQTGDSNTVGKFSVNMATIGVRFVF
jgi:opacity protein-like surface antigen